MLGIQGKGCLPVTAALPINDLQFGGTVHISRQKTLRHIVNTNSSHRDNNVSAFDGKCFQNRACVGYGNPVSGGAWKVDSGSLFAAGYTKLEVGR
jgi:hypothetical protein